MWRNGEQGTALVRGVERCVGMVLRLTVMERYLDRESWNGALLKFQIRMACVKCATSCEGKAAPRSVIGSTGRNGGELQATPSDTPYLVRNQPNLYRALLYVRVTD